MSDPTMDDVARIAAGLSEAQRGWIDRLERFDLPFKKNSHFDCPAALLAISQSDSRGIVNCRLTSLGLAVRDHLKEQEQ